VSGRLRLRRQVGQLLIAGLEGPELSSIERAWWNSIQPSGVILFRRNIEVAEQTHRLLHGINLLSSAAPFRCVDLEGGLVDRFRDLIAPMPSAAAVHATGKPAIFRKHGRLIGHAARLVGFNTTLAPVLDLALPEAQAIMRTRVTSPYPFEVIRHASAFLDGLAGEGILACGKHFPGLGAGALDSHQSMPVIGRRWEELWQRDLAPYRALRARLPLVMIAHAAYPTVTGDMIPASVSPFWIAEVLQRRIRYSGLILSDDMEMGGILTQASIEEAAVAAIAAGTHLLEICKDPALVIRAFEALLREAEHSAAFRRIVGSAARKIAAAKRRLLTQPMTKPPSQVRVDKLRTAVLSFTEQISLT
jgi:beta-N-acetylhexosaminidase